MLDLGASPNYKDLKGLSPLYYCVTNSSEVVICELLLHDRSAVGATDLQGKAYCKCFTCFTKTFANLTTYSRKPGDYNGTIIFEIDIMKNSSPLNLKFTLFAMSKPKQQFFSAGLTALSAQLRVNQNKRNNQNNCEKVKFDKDLN